MTIYVGGKKRIAKYIHEFIYDVEEQIYPDRLLDYFEPFCGMASITLEFLKDDDDRKIIISDSNPEIIKFWKELKNKWLPNKRLKYITEKKYNKIKFSDEISAERTFIGYTFSFSGTYFGSFRGLYQSEDKTERNFQLAYNNLVKIQPLLKNLKINSAREYNDERYMDMVSEGNYLIYCDPPYKKSLGNGNNPSISEFDTDTFWKVMRKWSKKNLVFISEDYGSQPPDFVPVWYKKVNRSFYGKNKKDSIDCLFVHKNTQKKYKDILKIKRPR